VGEGHGVATVIEREGYDWVLDDGYWVPDIPSSDI